MEEHEANFHSVLVANWSFITNDNYVLYDNNVLHSLALNLDGDFTFITLLLTLVMVVIINWHYLLISVPVGTINIDYM